MPTERKSIFLYGNPTSCKRTRLINTQTVYTDLINRFIEEMGLDDDFLLDLLNNNKQSPKIRQLEKEIRNEHDLGSAYGQNAIDMAVKELHNHVIRIRNKVYGNVQQHHPEMEMYIAYKSLLNASVLKLDEIEIIESLMEKEKSKKKPVRSKLEEYEALLKKLHALGSFNRTECKETVAALFLERLENSRLPFVKKAPLQLDSRISTMETSHSTKEHFVVFVKLHGSKERVAFPVSTSQNSLRRMNQYQTGSLTISTTKNGKVRIGVPFSKKVKSQKGTKENILSMDAGITDLINTNTGNKYGTFKGMGKLYEELVEPKLSNRSSLRNLMKRYQHRLKKSNNPYEKDLLRRKIHHIASSLNSTKEKDKCLRRYAHEADLRINQAVNSFIEEAKGLNATCVYEDLDITAFDRGKKNNKRDSMWVRGQLIKKIQSKLDWMGIPHIAVDPAYTSKACPKCSNIDDKNRCGKSFVCTVCKHKDDADHNASINIEQRVFDDEVKEIVEKYTYNTKKRHEAIRELFVKRHRSYKKDTPAA